jgi:hypothetical protein
MVMKSTSCFLDTGACQLLSMWNDPTHGWTTTPTAIHVLLDLPFYLVDQANAIADCLENQFTPHDLCEENHERRAEARVQALLAAEDNDSPKKIIPCHLTEINKYVNIEKGLWN